MSPHVPHRKPLVTPHHVLIFQLIFRLVCSDEILCSDVFEQLPNGFVNRSSSMSVGWLYIRFPSINVNRNAPFYAGNSPDCSVISLVPRAHSQCRINLVILQFPQYQLQRGTEVHPP
ncbi:uncharacterized protein J3D65DRAFT_629105 [Phyllosticta citribraziliensis]|uniref:Secreted protein n=1 Tax=Phyllosticta citribraziliensis TaxID=989973 RepID=A0ABR1LHZ7_9PEZI